ncbi:MAG: hypothetical protein HQK49_04930 [Oligoflexia bacterium]|nr:hypothetical protein [Oligoflexia bacterium]
MSDNFIDKIPPINHPIWIKVLTQGAQIKFESLQVQLFISKVKIALLVEKDEKKKKQLENEYANNLFNIFTTNINLPSVQKDLTKLLEVFK